MPTARWGEEINLSTSQFTKLKSKNDKIQFRIIKEPIYDGKHFLKDEQGNWNIQPCVRINEGIECEYCVNFFKAKARAKREGLDKKATQRLTDPWKCTVSFYIPVINRETGKFEIFQTTKGVRDAINAEADLGTKILQRDLIVVRTEKPGNSYYKLSVVDSSETKKLTKDEKVEFAKGKETDLSQFVNGKKEEGDLANEANSETIDEQIDEVMNE